jgi:intracellular sulfur oxidation DsrE/DsrF family protein
MDRRRSFLALLTAAAAVITGRRAGAAEGGKKHRAVFDVTADTPEKWDGVLRNVENLRRALGPENVEAQLVVHGKAYPLVQATNTAMEERLRALSQGGVRLSLCQNTMKRFNVEKGSLFPFVDTVDAAVAELVRKQGAGWAYLKVGG